MLRRLLEVEEHVPGIMAKHLKVAALTPGEWILLELTVKLLNKFELVSFTMC